MNREINNTLSALVASGALLVAVLVLASPATSDISQIGQDSTRIVGIDTDALLADAMEQATSASDSDSISTGSISTSSTSTDTTSTRSTGTSSRWHHGSLAMPYFSFVPRG
ncbi:MAG TPA: hypothetical protein VFS82_09000 [Lysobacter sp.]|nr:hypothetical protein [Lysobacter sp.]